MTISHLPEQTANIGKNNPPIAQRTATYLEASHWLPLEFDKIERIIRGQSDAPGEILGRTDVSENGHDLTVICAFVPDADRVYVVSSNGKVLQEMRLVHEQGFYRAVCASEIYGKDAGRYRLRVEKDNQMMTVHDPYSFESILSEMDLHLIGEGNHEEIYDRLGAQLRTIDGVQGVNFAVWAPNAAGISLVGSFNDWDGRRHPMRKHQGSGIWEIFIPEVGPGATYKFRLTDIHGRKIDKSDPFGFQSELPPRTASIVVDINEYAWSDDKWMQKRAQSDSLDQPMSVYEVHLGSWRQDEQHEHGWFNYRELAHQLVDYCKEMNFTHLELLPISEHPYTGSWGYQTVGYFAATSRYGTPDDFKYFVDYCHQNDIGVIIDWVPAHFPKDGHGLARFDGTALYEHADPRQGYHPDWDTLIFNYDRNEVRNFLISNAMFWLDKYHIDGLRVDAVASMLYLDYSRNEGEWIPNKYGGRENLGAIEFLKEMNTRVHGAYPGVLTIAEESTAWSGVSRPVYSGGLGFSLKWNMGWMNDTLRYMRHDSVHRKYHHDELTFSLIYAFSENFMLPFSHDEVVHGKGSLLDQMPGDAWQKFANLRLLYTYMWTHPGKKLNFMGNEWGQWNEWNCDEALQWDLLEWDTHKGLQKLVSDLNRVYREQPALYDADFESGGFEWIDCQNRESSSISYLRRTKDASEFVLVSCNFTPVVHEGFRLGVPEPGEYQEIFNSDSSHYSGTNVGNGSAIKAEQIEAHGRKWSIEIALPPIGAAIFKKVSDA
ncbi:MAG: 1,4-alpha-glucan branching protein GlgB [Planctomycetota bacterium]